MTAPAREVNVAVRAPVLWGLIVGVVTVGMAPLFWWLELSTVHALSITVIAAVYIGFAVADGRPNVIGTEAVVASLFVVIAAIAVTETAWLLVVAYAAHGCKDLWQHRSQFVANTRWWPPFCCAVDWFVAVTLAVMIIAGISFH